MEAFAFIIFLIYFSFSVNLLPVCKLFKGRIFDEVSYSIYNELHARSDHHDRLLNCYCTVKAACYAVCGQVSFTKMSYKSKKKSQKGGDGILKQLENINTAASNVS